MHSEVLIAHATFKHNNLQVPLHCQWYYKTN